MSITQWERRMRALPKTLTRLVFILLIAVFWPWIDTPQRYVNWKDRFRTSIPIAIIFGLPCAHRQLGYIEYRLGPECYRYDAPKRYRGVWMHEFEGSYFYEGPQKLPQLVSKSGLTWLDARLPPYPLQPWARYHLVEIEFIGRRTTVPGNYGHGGLSRHEIQIERVIAFRPLSRPKVYRVPKFAYGV